MYKLEETLIGDKLKLLPAIHIIFFFVICYHTAVELARR